MAWIEVHQSLPTHKKLKRFKRALGLKTTSEALGKIVMLWLWALDNAPDGNLADVYPDDMAEAADARNGDELVRALKAAGLLDDDMRLHDWDDYAGRLITQRENSKAANRERQKRYYDAHTKKPNAKPNALGEALGNENLTPPNGSCQTPPNGSTVPYRTQPYPTVPYSSSNPFAEVGEEEQENSKIPDVESVKKAAEAMRLNIDAEQFIRESNERGWRDGNGKPVRDWRVWLMGWARLKSRMGTSDPAKPTPTSMQYAQREYTNDELEKIGMAFLNEADGEETS